jgi:hypothetical protein
MAPMNKMTERGVRCFDVEPAQGAAFNPYGRDLLRNRRGKVRNRGVDDRYWDLTNDSIAVGPVESQNTSSPSPLAASPGRMPMRRFTSMPFRLVTG